MNVINYFDKKKKSAKTFFEKWSDSRAKIWDYQVSHSNLTIRLEKPGVKGNLHIICIEPIHICSKFIWENCNVELDIIDEIFIIKDINSDFELRCMDIEVKENCKPLT
jgi:hypothetical protein